jgi:hypothetical protein
MKWTKINGNLLALGEPCTQSQIPHKWPEVHQNHIATGTLQMPSVIKQKSHRG